tara:strand:- start:402 stop:1757 length:1356 start_codon:yes stop_codon:yes gene_type:complete
MSDADQIDPSELESIANPTDGRSDPNKTFPRQDYVGVSSVNNIARGTRVKNVYIGGSVPGVDLELNDEPSTQYPENQVKETSSGHIIEYDDTNGRERVMIRHRTGSGVEMRADGTVILSSTNNTLRIVAANEKVIVEGDGEVVYNGNLKMKVAGDFDLEVGGDFNVNVIGDKEENVRGSFLESITKNKTTTVAENRAETVLGVDTLTVLSDKNQIIKGNYENVCEGLVEIDAGGNLVMTSEKKSIMTSPDVNISARSLSVVGDSGTVGGESITQYFNNIFARSATFTEGVTAPTFHGDLQGTAVGAEKAVTAAVGPAHSGSASNTPTNTTQTSKPNTTILTSVINSPEYGVRQVDVDAFQDLKFSVDRSRNYGGISKVDLTTKMARSKLRDPNNISNETFVGEIIADGTISKDFPNTIPPKFGKVVNANDKAQRGTEAIGPSNPKGKVFQT